MRRCCRRLTAAPFCSPAPTRCCVEPPRAAAFPLNALAFFYAGWRLTGICGRRSSPACIGALYPFHGEHYSHLELEWTFFTPLALVALLDVIVRPSARRGAWLGALIAAQWLASMYLG
jgi:hypothetical protein